MKKIFYLNSCETCRKIMAKFDIRGWELREIKKEPITQEEVEAMYRITQSYEDLFSKKSTQIKLREIDLKTLTEEDYKELLLDHYTFLKRPVFLTDKEIFIGSDKKNIDSMKAFFNGN